MESTGLYTGRRSLHHRRVEGRFDHHPDWYYNLLRYPSVSIEVGSENVMVEASVAAGAERDRLYAQHAERMPQFREYARSTTREIPVVILTPKS